MAFFFENFLCYLTAQLYFFAKIYYINSCDTVNLAKYFVNCTKAPPIILLETDRGLHYCKQPAAFVSLMQAKMLISPTRRKILKMNGHLQPLKCEKNPFNCMVAYQE
jgi:hypothetical protein